MNTYLGDTSLYDTLKEVGFIQAFSTITSLEIIDQMPFLTTIQKIHASLWRVTFPITDNFDDFREDADPHRAAALAFVAWKKGLQT